MLDRLRLFVTDPYRVAGSAGTDIDEVDPIPVEQAWTVQRWDTDWDGDAGYELVLSGPGVSGSDGILVAVQTWKNTVQGACNWALNGYTVYSSMLEFLTQVGSINSFNYNYLPQVLLNNSSMKYWFFANGRRICGVVKVAGVYYASFYLGYYLPYGLPNAFPYPLMIGGSAAYAGTEADDVYSSSAITNQGFVNGYHENATGNLKKSALVLRNSEWYSFGNYASDAVGSVTFKRNTWPHIHGYFDDLSWYITKDPADGVPLFPVILMMTTPQKNIFGEMDGIKAVLCDGVVAEDTIEYDGNTYIVFQNGSRTTSINKFAILKE